MGRVAISYWGPSGWTFLHATSYSYPEYPTETEKNDMSHFITYFAKVLPCKKCREDFALFLAKNFGERKRGAILKTKRTLVEFLIDAHNYVNNKLGKRIFSYKEVDNLYLGNGFPARCCTILILIIIIIVMICLKRRVINTNSLKLYL